MGIEHENADTGAEADTFRESIQQFNNIITKDENSKAGTLIEYIVGEGDPPFIKYRLMLEAISTHTPEEFEKLKEEATQKAA